MSYHDYAAEFRKQLGESADLKRALAASQGEAMAACAAATIEALQQGRSVWFCGNGGSFTDAHHIVGELVGRYGYDRPALPAFVLGAGVATMTAIANDYGYDQVFSREVKGSVRAGDVVFGLTTSGNSPNVCAALAEAKLKGAKTVAWVGEKRGKVDDIADIVLHVPSALTPRIQECHIAVGHVLCDLVERALFPRG